MAKALSGAIVKTLYHLKRAFIGDLKAKFGKIEIKNDEVIAC
ncbi:hypothetical protein yaldo0001_18480 [Yersinia aldovae ATCC 35236]|nr:hypothetical protein yaldo0001_18480 [Yersinia aldovae ATCC 35236]